MSAVPGPDRAWLDQLGPDEGCTCAQPDPSLLADHEQSCALMLCHRCGMKRPDHIPGDDRCHPACGRQHLDDALPSLLAAARERDALRAAVEGLHLPSHAYCVVCDVDRDVEAVGNAFPCDHYTSFCRHCDFAWPCPTARVVADTTGEAL